MESAGADEELLGILDAGAQYGKVIDRRIRELGVHSELMPLDACPDEVWGRFKAIIISGGPESVYGPTAPAFNREIIRRAVQEGKPILGICYGMQLLNYHFGGTVEKKTIRQDGVFALDISESSSLLFQGINSPTQVLLTHGDSVSSLGTDLKCTSTSPAGIPTSLEHNVLPIYGVQFHPEVDLSQDGNTMLSNFLFRVCGFAGSYSLGCRRQLAIKYLKETCEQASTPQEPCSVLVLVSGGVDSSVCAALLYEALGKERVHCLHVDSGFMRECESEQVDEALGAVGIDLKVVHAKDTFLHGRTEIDGVCTESLTESESPEVKRKIIGDTFMRVCEREIAEMNLGHNVLLAQGTLRPDLIESASKLASSSAQVIKTHHNDTFLVRQLRDAGRIVEPLKDYHKDEVRQLGATLGLPENLLWRQPFPGPGLAIRIICARDVFMHEHQAEIQKRLDAFPLASGLHARLLPCRTVGVQGDGRSYSSLVGLFGPADWDGLFEAAREIPKCIHEVNRVVYVPRGKVEEFEYAVTETLLRDEEIAQLQKADAIVNRVLFEENLVRKLSQVPVILFPASFGRSGCRSIALRPFITNDFMTGRAARPGMDFEERIFDKLVDEILANVPGIAEVVLDITSKPPGTTEWE